MPRDDDVCDLGVDVLPGVAVALAGVGAAGTDDGLGGFAGLLGDLQYLQRPLLCLI
ncbi:hypothetical protein [Streptomyces lydicamycinicus]|uniref:hypothetical protein n=1 Tax=Streptomyces lydicamycinicus TaxID=1546107 RepID=UPI003C2E1A16